VSTVVSGIRGRLPTEKARVRFITAAALVNELVEPQHHNQLGRALARWSLYELFAAP
jgi:hypothetical protein